VLIRRVVVRLPIGMLGVLGGDTEDKARFAEVKFKLRKRLEVFSFYRFPAHRTSYDVQVRARSVCAIFCAMASKILSCVWRDWEAWAASRGGHIFDTAY
jgi:hypothetical protein